MVPPSQKTAARVPQAIVLAKVNTSATFSCESQDGVLWNLCFWQQKSQGQQQLVMVDQAVAASGGRTLVDGISYVGDVINNDGKCAIKIGFVTERDFGQWSCTLVCQTGQVFNGEVEVHNGM